MSELSKLTSILTKVVREVVREELEFTKKQMMNEMRELGLSNTTQTLRENLYQAPSQLPKMFAHFAPPLDDSKIVSPPPPEPKKMNVSYLQQLANAKMQNPDEEFMSLKL